MATQPMTPTPSPTPAANQDALLWGDLRSLMHATHIDVESTAQLFADLLEQFPSHSRDVARAYAHRALSQRKRQHEITSELGDLEAPGFWDDDADRMSAHVNVQDHIISLDLTEWDEEDDEWALEMEEWYWEEMLIYNIIEPYIGERPYMDCIDLLGHFGASAYFEEDEDGNTQRVVIQHDFLSDWCREGEVFVFEDNELHPITDYFDDL